MKMEHTASPAQSEFCEGLLHRFPFGRRCATGYTKWLQTIQISHTQTKQVIPDSYYICPLVFQQSINHSLALFSIKANNKKIELFSVRKNCLWITFFNDARQNENI
jgi:hypothetical protein